MKMTHMSLGLLLVVAVFTLSAEANKAPEFLRASKKKDRRSLQQGCVKNGVCFNGNTGRSRECCAGTCDVPVGNGNSKNLKCSNDGAAAAAAGGNCFARDTLVEVQNKGLVAMADVQVGNYVLLTSSPSSADDSSSKSYSRVYAWAHKSDTEWTDFLEIHYHIVTKPQEAKVLHVTGDHLIFVEHGHSVRADALDVGDVLQYKDHDEMLITKITTVQRQGLYAPLTHDGTVLLHGGIRASSYTLQQEHEWQHALMGISQHDFIHLTLSPYRLWCTYYQDCQPHHANNPRGMPWYVSTGLDFYSGLMHNPWWCKGSCWWGLS